MIDRRQPIAVLAAIVAVLSAAAAVRAEGDARKGREIAVAHCARCHVIPDHNPHGGLGSTPSFRTLANASDSAERFRTFYARRPHPVFVEIPGIAPLAAPTMSVTPFSLTLEDVEHVTAFARSLHRPD